VLVLVGSKLEAEVELGRADEAKVDVLEEAALDRKAEVVLLAAEEALVLV
jgi:hypothetical protein